MAGENSKIRHLVLPFIPEKGNGIDLGYGGDAITPNTIAMDMVDKYGTAGDLPQQLFGDATNLYWFKDEVLDYVFSSHLLEDFVDTKGILNEWLRVLKPKGVLILYLPNEARFKAHCNKTGQIYNWNHKCDAMSLEYMSQIFKELNLREIYSYDEEDKGYSFVIIGQKQ